MIEIRHEKLNIEKPYRCIVVSDIHSHYRRRYNILQKQKTPEERTLTYHVRSPAI